MTTTYRAIEDTFTDSDDSAARLATLDAIAEAEANTVGTAFACQVCGNADADRLAIHEDAVTWVECLACLNVYEVDMPAPVIINEPFETEAERVCVEPY